MPVRFQVDPDFYDHPKTVGMSDAAVALWTRAGSYSAAKLTDGFIAEHVLALLSQTPQEAADELKRRGLWSRVKGGYQFHEWGERNLTKQRVQDDQRADRDRKRKERAEARKAAGQNGKPKVEPQNVRQDSERTPDGIQAESDENPAVSVSGSVSGSGREPSGSHPPPGEPPPPRCPKHLDNPTEDPCRPCGDARTAREAWDAEHERRQRHEAALAKSRSAKERAELVATEIRNCQRCDHLGRLPSHAMCNHEPEASPGATAAAREVARAAARRSTGEHRDAMAELDALAPVIPLRPEEPT